MVHPHRSKRPFQPPITTYFSSDSPSLYAQQTPNAVQPSSIAPPLPPAAVQSSLLNVGMRIRKSVPEGYKTRKDLSPSSLSSFLENPFDNSTTKPPTEDFEEPKISEDESSTRASELVPFCGLHRIGGFAVGSQGLSSRFGVTTGLSREHKLPVNAFGFMSDGLDGLSSLPSSQESSVSTDSIPSRKRALDEGSGHYFAEQNDFIEELQFPEDMCFNTPPSLVKTGRAIAAARGAKGRMVKREGGLPQLQSAVDLDFEDAEFLTPKDAMMEM